MRDSKDVTGTLDDQVVLSRGDAAKLFCRAVWPNDRDIFDLVGTANAERHATFVGTLEAVACQLLLHQFAIANFQFDL